MAREIIEFLGVVKKEQNFDPRGKDHCIQEITFTEHSKKCHVCTSILKKVHTKLYQLQLSKTSNGLLNPTSKRNQIDNRT